MGNNIHQKGDSRSCGRWDDSWVGYMISCSAERYVNVAKGASQHLYQKVPENTKKFMFHGVTDSLWNMDWQGVSHRWWLDYFPPYFQPQKPLIFMNVACESSMVITPGAKRKSTPALHFCLYTFRKLPKHTLLKIWNLRNWWGLW